MGPSALPPGLSHPASYPRPRPRPRRPGRPRAPVRHLRRDRVSDRVREGVQHRGPVVPLASPGRAPQRARSTGAGLPRRAVDPAQPPLRGRVHLRPAPRHQAPRRETVPHHPAAGGMDLLHPRRPPRIHHPGPVRRQPRTAGRQRRRARPGPGRRAAPRRTGRNALLGHPHGLRHLGLGQACLLTHLRQVRERDKSGEAGRLDSENCRGRVLVRTRTGPRRAGPLSAG